MKSVLFKYVTMFLSAVAVSCLQGCSDMNTEQSSPITLNDQTSFMVNSRGDSILTRTPFQIEGIYHHIDPSFYPSLLSIEQTKELVKINPRPQRVGQPGLNSIPRMDTMPSINHNALRKIQSKGKPVALKYPLSVETLKPEIKGTQVDIRYWGIDQNMANSSIWTMIQDRRGDLWFGSLGSGAIRFDGERFDHFSESEGLGHNYVYSIYEDSKGHIWFGTAAGGVTSFDGQTITKFTSENGLAHNFVLSIIEDHQGNMWFGTRGGLCLYDGEEFTHYTTQEGLAYNEVISIYEDSKHQLWVGTGRGTGMHLFDREKFIHFNVGEGIGANDVHAILEDKNGVMWFGTWGGGINRYDGKNFERFTTQQGLPSNDILSILEDHEGNLWLGVMGGGVTKYNGHSFINYTEEVGLSSNDVRFVLEDDKKNIWACTMNNGVNRINPHGFQQLDRNEHQNLGEVGSFVQGQNGSIWLATSTGLLEYDGIHLTQYTNKKSQIDQGIMTVFEDREENIWMGVGGGVSVLSKSGIKDFTTQQGLTVGDVRAIIQDKSGHMWLGTYSAGVIRYDGEGFTQYSEKNGFISDDIYALFEDSKGHLWFGSHGGGISRYDGKYFTVWTSQEGLIHNSVRTIIEDHDGNMWLGTEGGLSKFNGEQFENFSVHDGMIHNKIFSMLLHKNEIWIKTQKGISILDPKDNQFTNLDKSDVLGQHNLSPGHVIIDRKNKLWAGNIQGAVILDLNQFDRSEYLPLKLNITDIKINDESIDFRGLIHKEEDSNRPAEIGANISLSEVTSFYNLPENLTIPYQLNHLTFHVSAIDWGVPGKMSYSFYLEGLDKEWSTPQLVPRMDYRNLSHGRFTLKVKAMNQSGIWSDPITYSFKITPPWYHTWLAYALYVLIAIWSLFYLYRILLTRKIAIAEGQRLKEIDDLKTNIYTNITHEFRTPLTVINGMATELEQSSEEEIVYTSQMIKRNSQKLLSMVNQILRLSKLKAKKEKLHLQQADIILFLKYLVASHSSLALAKGISLQFIFEEDRLFMDFDADKVEAVLSNLISNAIKFTGKEGWIVVKTEQRKINDNSVLMISVKDNGKGIVKEELPFVFDRFHQAPNNQNGQGTGIGLAIVKELVSLMRGTIKVESAIGKGSEFNVQIPIEKNAPFPTSIPHASLTKDKIVPDLLNDETNSAIPASKLPVLLIIEDNADIVKYLHYCLKEKYTLLTSRNGDQGIEEAIQSIPDLIISDIMMPGKDGFEVCTILKEDKRTNHIPIILLTARVTSDDKLKGLASGADAYLPKPFEKEELLIRLEKLLLIRKTLQEKYLKELKGRFGPGQISGGQRNRFISQVENAIMEHLADEDFTANELAGIMHLSRSQLNRKIKAATGMATSLYIRHLRLLESQKLLRNSDLSVTQILYQVGFNSPAYFSKAYKNLFGYNPTAERDSSTNDIQ